MESSDGSPLVTFMSAGAGLTAHSALRVDISEGSALRIRFTPLISHRKENGWNEVKMNAIELPQPDQLRAMISNAD